MNAVSAILNAVLAMLDKETFVKLMDKLFDAIEDACADSANKIDDAVVITMIGKARELLGVPDDDNV